MLKTLKKTTAGSKDRMRIQEKLPATWLNATNFLPATTAAAKKPLVSLPKTTGDLPEKTGTGRSPTKYQPETTKEPKAAKLDPKGSIAGTPGPFPDSVDLRK
ncbi:hypothetical protein [Mangrovibacterium lignilyticum]|uniref:hypothetical protein n=1 Tax=Mangrovibacterium lignilyticum TaxID=2668052 RepID=UPI0013D7E4F9|nr:hypothetical protein [Mangrovibacterium lignilyticum]